MAAGYQTMARLLALRDVLRSEPHTWEQIQTRLPDCYTDDENGKRKLRLDLQCLEQWGYQKDYDRTVKAYSLIALQIDYDWTESELTALAALRESFTKGAPYADTIQMLLMKIEKGLNNRDRKVYARKPALTIKFAAAEEQSSAAATRRKLEHALREHQRISFRYRPSDRPKVIHHPDDEPIDLIFDDGHYYLWAHCYKMNKVYPFRVDMIVPDSVEILPNRAQGGWRRQTIHFQYWLSPKIAARGVTPRFPEMDWEPQSDRSMIGTAQAYSDFHAIQGVLRYGEQAEILGPDRLRAKMRRVVEQMAEMYGRGGWVIGWWRG